MSNSVFDVRLPKKKARPLIVSCPHSGTGFPPEISAVLKKKFLNAPPDTDWFIDRLYDFVPDLGGIQIAARYSRYVIDLNRHPDSKRLYSDSRRETALVPEFSFAEEALYETNPPDETEVKRRRIQYYDPYYSKIQNLIAELKKEHGHVIFFDAHSIKHLVPSIQKDPFPDLILSNQKGQTSDPAVFLSALEALRRSNYTVAENHPFLGGQLTRQFGSPGEGVHSMQLEMSQRIYMDEDRTQYRDDLADEVREVLKSCLSSLISKAESL